MEVHPHELEEKVAHPQCQNQEKIKKMLTIICREEFKDQVLVIFTT